ncbi:hypothetical protein HAX54_037762 [Datura stramonium]|uniref:NB-ARC domain-containing protein n=1 Tax=Datura stramonium TaxID=4076 RepID=A0ABS8RML3_DATST|nr:hypothetical protein [Datura stramonium]
MPNLGDATVGLDDDLTMIIERLTGPPSALDIVTISGMGGIGKTTLATQAYDHLAISDDQLAVLLKRKLKFRRYLVVVDDIWSMDTWDIMTRIFPDDNNGSRILLTTRQKEVAMYANPDSPPHEMNLLTLYESWKLLRDKVFGANIHSLSWRTLGSK